jgi:hypothetical protein
MLLINGGGQGNGCGRILSETTGNRLVFFADFLNFPNRFERKMAEKPDLFTLAATSNGQLKARFDTAVGTLRANGHDEKLDWTLLTVRDQRGY